MLNRSRESFRLPFGGEVGGAICDNPKLMEGAVGGGGGRGEGSTRNKPVTDDRERNVYDRTCVIVSNVFRSHPRYRLTNEVTQKKKKKKTKPINEQSALIARLIFDLHRVATQRHPSPVFLPLGAFSLSASFSHGRSIDTDRGFCVTAAG